MDDYMKINASMINEIEGKEVIKTDTEKQETQQSMKEKVSELVGKLEDGLKEIFDSDKYKNYLNTMAKFHNYSVNNTLLINQQKPDATLVAGFDSWARNFGRHVKKGERGIKIIAPAPYMVKKEKQLVDPKTGEKIFNPDGTPKTTEVEVKIPVFKVSYVYDISQTYGKELPTLGVAELGNTVDRAKDYIDSLKKVSPVPIEFGVTNGDSKGFYSLSNQSITIKDGMSDAQTIKTMVHEISHAKLHNPEALKEEGKRKSKGTIEMEAESVAYIVCQHFGIDTSDYSFGYIAGWSEGKGTEELKESMQSIRETSSEMIYRIEGNLRAIDRDKAKQEEVSISETDKDNEFMAVSSEDNPLSPGDTKEPVIEPIDKTVTKKPEKEPNKDSNERKSLKAKLQDKKKEVAKEKEKKTLSKEKKKEKEGAR
ncbi:MAG: ssDNA-binding domain-containing protein [Lachnospiraceae bacterium]|nr:ssDNA-binding domain-containing protein [Lachnospiraceae bacterium]